MDAEFDMLARRAADKPHDIPSHPHPFPGGWPTPGMVADELRLEPAQKGADPWKHRSSGMKCATCMWHVTKIATPDRGEGQKLGRCRRHAPTMNGYPAVFETDWCGDHKLDENKL